MICENVTALPVRSVIGVVVKSRTCLCDCRPRPPPSRRGKIAALPRAGLATPDIPESQEGDCVLCRVRKFAASLLLRSFALRVAHIQRPTVGTIPYAWTESNGQSW